MSRSLHTAVLSAFLEYAPAVLTQGRTAMMQQFIQHGDTSTLEHCVAVACYSLILAVRLGIRCDRRALVRGALLHDYFLYDWHRHSGRWHGFTHPGAALRNALQDFHLSRREADLIGRHMFPLLPRPPRYVEGYLVCLTDKYCSLRETFSRRPYARHGTLVARCQAEARRMMEQMPPAEES